jgi:carboxyl-terminal processing protease
VLHEADLRGAFKNSDAEALEKGGIPTAGVSPPAAAPAGAAAKPDGAAPPVVPAGAKPLPKPEANTLDPAVMGTDQDYQLIRAMDLLRGVNLFKKLAEQ